jgi:hypothetical protein
MTMTTTAMHQMGLNASIRPAIGGMVDPACPAERSVTTPEGFASSTDLGYQGWKLNAEAPL